MIGFAVLTVLFFVRFPPPFTGETIGSREAYEILRDEVSIRYIPVVDEERESRLSGRFSLSNAIHTLRLFRAVGRELRDHEYDALYFVPGASILGHVRDLVLIWLVGRRVKKIVAHIRSGNYADVLTIPVIQRFSRKFVRRVDVFIALSNVLADAYTSVVPGDKIRVIRNCIDQEVTLSADEVVKKIDGRRAIAVLNVLYVSNMYEEKGYRDVGKALAMIPESVNWRADFVGSWPSRRQRASFESEIVAWGVQSRVRIHGAIRDRQKIKALLVEADVFVLPTYYPVEAQPRCIIEALNAATPIIATPHASIPEYVSDHENGFLVPARAPKEIALALECLADRNLWARMARNARTTYENMFDREIIKQGLLSVLRG